MEIRTHDLDLELHGKQGDLTVAITEPSGKMTTGTIISLTPSKEDIFDKKRLNWPGEYEITDILVTIFQNPETTNPCTTFFNIDDVSFFVCPLSSLPLQLEVEEALGNIDVIVGLDDQKTKEARGLFSKVLDTYEPRIIILIGTTETEAKEISSRFTPVESTQIDKKKLPSDTQEWYLFS